MIFVTSPTYVVSHIIPPNSNITDYQLQQEIDRCKELGFDKYIHDFNTSISKAKESKQKHFYKGYTFINPKVLMEYISRTEMTMEPITEIKF